MKVEVFRVKRLIGYFESHDEERIMYKALQFGNDWDGYNIQELNTALSRMSAIGAMSLTIPGPKDDMAFFRFRNGKLTFYML